MAGHPPPSSIKVVAGNLVDVHQRRIYPAEVTVRGGRIVDIRETSDSHDRHILPGFVDAHVHVESSMLTPSQFARAAVVHGTVATVSDPHEIGNVLGVEGVRYMLEDAARVPFKVFFGAPSCVPATPFESAGAEINAEAIAELLADDRITYLSEMMNYPGVLAGDTQVMRKIAAAKRQGCPVDGHAPSLRGAEAAKYIAAGISTDHECTTKEEALDKLAAGALIQIREGSAARNYEALHTLVDEYPNQCMFCTDDKHPDEFLAGHIDQLVRRSLNRGMDLYNVLRCATVNPVLHYGLDVGLLRVGDAADFIVVDDLRKLAVVETHVAGRLLAADGHPCFEAPPARPINRFRVHPKTPGQFRVPAESNRLLAIEAIDGELVTRGAVVDAKVEKGRAVPDARRDLLKIAVVNRYADVPPAVAFIRNIGITRGALASSVAHDCHNIVAVGTNDEDLCAAVNAVIACEGGLAACAGPVRKTLPLPVAGLMATGACEEVGAAYSELDRFAKELGSRLRAPFMTLSFMALLVIPRLKLSDRGLFDGEKFEFTSLFV